MREVDVLEFTDDENKRAKGLTTDISNRLQKGKGIQSEYKIIINRTDPQAVVQYLRSVGFPHTTTEIDEELEERIGNHIFKETKATIIVPHKVEDHEKYLETHFLYEQATYQLLLDVRKREFRNQKEIRRLFNQAHDHTIYRVAHMTELPVETAHYWLTNTKEVHEMHHSFTDDVSTHFKLTDMTPEDLYDQDFVQKMELSDKSGPIYRVANNVIGLPVDEMVKDILTNHVPELEARNEVIYRTDYMDQSPHKRAADRIDRFDRLKQFIPNRFDF